jgi:ABC-type glycerol-3-phosphate transport system permease component
MTSPAVAESPRGSTPVDPVAAATPRGRRRDPSTQVNQLLPRPLLVVITAALVAAVLAPIAYIFLASLNTDVGVASGEFWPSTFSLESYTKIWTTVGLGHALLNSLIVCGATAVVSALLSVGTAYVLVRYEFLGRLAILRGLLGLQSIPGTLMLLPVFVLFASAGTYLGIVVIGTRWGLFLAYLTFALPFSTWVLVTYLRGLPRELEEAARIDGASSLQILLRIIVPLSLPAIVVSGIFAFLLGWNDVLFASIFTRPDTHTAAVALQVFGAAQEGGALPVYSQMMAAALVCAAPVVILYFVFQRYLVGGLTAGGVK